MMMTDFGGGGTGTSNARGGVGSAIAAADDDAGAAPPSCWRRMLDFALCRRTIRDGSEYIVLRADEDVDMAELEGFLKDNFGNLGVSSADLSEIDRESEVTKHLLRLLPVYKRCVRRQTRLDRLLANQCRPHLRNAAEIECQKSKRVMQALDIVILKLLVGEFTLSDEDSVERLLEKFSVDQSTLCEVGRIVRLIDMDRENTQRLVDGREEPAPPLCDLNGVPSSSSSSSYAATTTISSASDLLLRELDNAPAAPDHLPGEIDEILLRDEATSGTGRLHNVGRRRDLEEQKQQHQQMAAL
ncbi:M71 protein [Murid betaherpesvirus 1]|uniref:Tegument protein UL51 homolog n=1 Tax=Murid herpesvirus 1 TaxID=10366 RepID=H2A1C6_MUHV1|nr:M71 protein [Murid betaherpesvirus 1]